MSTEHSVEPTAILKRETLVPSSDRGRLAAIIATCSMAGLAGGMALSMLAESQRVADEMRREQLKQSMRVAGDDAIRSPVTWLGLRMETASEHRCVGARINEVISGSPADRVGFRVGDIVQTFAGDRVCDSDHLVAVVQYSSIGSTPAVTVRRGAETVTLHPQLGVMPSRFR